MHYPNNDRQQKQKVDDEKDVLNMKSPSRKRDEDGPGVFLSKVAHKWCIGRKFLEPLPPGADPAGYPDREYKGEVRTESFFLS